MDALHLVGRWRQTEVESERMLEQARLRGFEAEGKKAVALLHSFVCCGVTEVMEKRKAEAQC